jgi:hypothetical protein
MRVTEDDLHPHLRARMLQRGVSREDIEPTLNEAWEARDAKPDTTGRVMTQDLSRRRRCNSSRTAPHGSVVTAPASKD